MYSAFLPSPITHHFSLMFNSILSGIVDHEYRILVILLINIWFDYQVTPVSPGAGLFYRSESSIVKLACTAT